MEDRDEELRRSVDEEGRVAEDRTLIRSEERLITGTVQHTGTVRIRKEVEQVDVEEVVPYTVEHADVERVPAGEDDSGEVETLEDGTISVPVLEEQLFIEKRAVVVERLLVRKRVESKEERITDTLAREVVRIDADDEVEGRVNVADE